MKSIIKKSPAAITQFVKSKSQGSPQDYVSRLKASFMCPQWYRQNFLHSQAQMTISVGQSVHEGERLEAVIKLINQHFKACKIVVDDSIQWHTLAISRSNQTKAELLNLAIEAGDDYLSRNTKVFRQHFTIPYEIVRWRDWIDTTCWHEAIRSIYLAYQTNLTFKQAIRNNVNAFLQRYEKNNPLWNYDRSCAVELCTQYLLEECGVMKDIWITLGCQYEVYPSGRNEAMTTTHQLFIEPHYSNLLKPIAIRFNRRRCDQQQLEKE
jgi:hypothetical protein